MKWRDSWEEAGRGVEWSGVEPLNEHPGVASQTLPTGLVDYLLHTDWAKQSWPGQMNSALIQL